MLAPAALRETIDRYAAAVTAGVPADTAALFAEDAIQTDPATSPPNVGRDAICAFFQTAADAAESTRFDVLDGHTCGNQIAIDFRVTVTLEAGSMIITGIEVFSINDDGLISEVTAYWDGSDVAVDAG